MRLEPRKENPNQREGKEYKHVLSAGLTPNFQPPFTAKCSIQRTALCIHQDCLHRNLAPFTDIVEIPNMDNNTNNPPLSPLDILANLAAAAPPAGPNIGLVRPTLCVVGGPTFDLDFPVYPRSRADVVIRTEEAHVCIRCRRLILVGSIPETTCGCNVAHRHPQRALITNVYAKWGSTAPNGGPGETAHMLSTLNWNGYSGLSLAPLREVPANLSQGMAI